MVQADICKYIILSDTDRKKGDLQYPHPNVVHRFERSRWRDGRFACYAPYVMAQGRAFNCDFRFSLIFLSQAKSIGCKRKKDSIPIAVRSVQPLARIRRNRQRPPSNGSIERARSTSPGLHAFVKTRLR